MRCGKFQPSATPRCPHRENGKCPYFKWKWIQKENLEAYRMTLSDAGSVRGWLLTLKKYQKIGPKDFGIGITGGILFRVLGIQMDEFSLSGLRRQPTAETAQVECSQEIEVENGCSALSINLALPISLIPPGGMTILPWMIVILQQRLVAPHRTTNLYQKR